MANGTQINDYRRYRVKKKLAFLTTLVILILGAAAFAQQTVQVLMPETENLSGGETAWLPGQIQDRLKSNLQEYLGMSTVVDAASEAKVKQLQRESEDAGRDASTAIPAGNLITAKFAVLARIRKTDKGYTISVDYTDLTTGKSETVMSKEYETIEELYEKTGAIDEITLKLATRLNIAITPIQRRALQYGTADFSIDDQLRLAQQNKEQYEKMNKDIDNQLRALALNTDLNTVENENKIKAEQALLKQKIEYEQRRIESLIQQQRQAEEDAMKEAARSEEQRRRRDELSMRAEEKAAEVRRLKIERQGVLGQIKVIESKKKALIEIRQEIDARIEELREQAEKDKKAKAEEINNEEWKFIELEKGVPTLDARQRRNNRIAEEYKKRNESLLKEIKDVKEIGDKQEKELLTEIKSDQKKVEGIRTASSMGDELKVSYGEYSGANNGWNAYLSLYSDGTLLYQNSFLIEYKALTKKAAPNLTNAPQEAVQEYSDTVDMYNSLLLRGDPILYFELDYTTSVGSNDAVRGEYILNFKTLRIIDTITGKTIQTNSLNQQRRLVQEQGWDIRTKEEIASHIAEENKKEKKLIEISAKERAKERAKRERTETKKNQMEAQKGFYHELGGGGLGGFGLDFTYIGLGSDARLMGLNTNWNIAVRSWMFLDVGVMILGSSAKNQDTDIFVGVYGGIGVNRRIHIFKWHPAVYASFDIGGIMLSTEGGQKSDLDFGNQFFLKQSFGVVLPLVVIDESSLDLFACYSLMLFPGLPMFSDSFSVGLRFTLHFN